MPINLSNEQFQYRLDKYIRPSNAPTTDTHGRIRQDPAPLQLARSRHGRILQLGTPRKVLFMDEILCEDKHQATVACLPKVRFNLQNAKVV